MKTNRLQMIALLSASTVIVSWGIMNVNIPNMIEVFSEVPLALVENLATVSSLFIMIAVLLSHKIAAVLGYNKTVLAGLALVGFSGTLPILVGNFYVIFIARACLGFGIGMFQSLLVTFNKYFYSGAQRTRMFGFQTACEGFGGMTFTLIAGQLVKIGWKGIFFAYLLVIPIIILFGLFVPAISTAKVREKNALEESENDDSDQTSGQNGLEIGIGYVLLIFALATMFMTLGIKVGPMILFKGYGTATDGATVLLVLGLGAMSAGLTFSWVTAFLKWLTLPVMYALMAVAIFLVGYGDNVLVATVGGYLTGFSFRTIVPFLLNHINSGAFKSSSLITSLFLVALNLGFFMSPYVALLIGLVSWNDLPQTTFYVIALILSTMAAVTLIFKLLRQNRIKA